MLLRARKMSRTDLFDQSGITGNFEQPIDGAHMMPIGNGERTTNVYPKAFDTRFRASAARNEVQFVREGVILCDLDRIRANDQFRNAEYP